MTSSVYIAFVTGPPASTASYLDRIAESHSDSTLLVASRVRPPRGHWIEIRPGQGIGAIVAACRQAMAGRPLAGAAIHATRGGGEWRLRIAALLLAGRLLRVYNDHLDHFPLGDFRTLSQHLKWRYRQRSRGRLWWSSLAKLALASAAFAQRRTGPPAFPPRPSPPLPSGISLIIPTRDGCELLASMLPAVVADLQSHTAEVIVVDNGSSDGTAAFLQNNYPAVRIESSAGPLSFSAAVNRGIYAARYSHVVLLNNDMLIEPGFFTALERAFERDPGLFCATAQIFFPPGQRREETGLCFWRQNPGDEFPVYCAEPEPGEDGTLVLYGSGGCSMYDTAKLRELGGFDEAYQPAYVEDLDIGYRAWQRGWPTAFCAGARVEHRHRATTSRYYDPQYLDYLVERNYLRFLVRATGTLFPQLWRDAIVRLKLRAAAGDKSSRAALRIAWREALNRRPLPSVPEEAARKRQLTR